MPRTVTLDDIAPAAELRDGMRDRLSEQARPHVALAGLTVAGGVVHAISMATGQPATVAMAVSLVVVVAVLATRRLRRRWRTVVAAAVWLVWVAAAGLDWTTLATLLTTGVALALPHWRDHRIPDPPEWEPEPEREPVDDTTSYPALWAANNASTRGALTDSYLTGLELIPTGERYDLHLVPGGPTLATALSSLPRLRSGLLLRPAQDLILERHPRLDESKLLATIVRQSQVLLTPQVWPGPVYDRNRGTIALGPYVDGEGTAEWLLHADNGLLGGFLGGSTRSGKSRTLEGIALGAAAAGCVVAWGDPQGGTSSNFLTRHADWVARGTPGIEAMLDGARQLKRLRQIENTMHGWDGWTPDQGRPGLLIIIDESHGPMADERICDKARELAQEGAKVGIALVFASQELSLKAFGNSEALRSNVCAGNLVLMRIKSKNAKNILPGVSVDPGEFPRIAGYGFLVDDTGTRRSAPFRSFFLDDASRVHAGQTTVWAELDEPGAAAIGPEYQLRRVASAGLDETLAAEYAAMINGHGPALREPAPVPSAMQVHPLPAWTGDQLATATGDQGRRTAVEATWGLLTSGVTAPGEIQAQSGYSETAVRNALRELTEAGRAHNPRHGVWEPAAELAGQGGKR